MTATEDREAARPLDLVPVALACGHAVTAYRKDSSLPLLYCHGCRKPVPVEGSPS